MNGAPTVLEPFGRGDLARRTVFVHPTLGRIAFPRDLLRTISLPGQPTRRMANTPLTIVVAEVRRPRRRDDGTIIDYQTVWHSITHNDRVNAGGEQLDFLVFGRAPTVSATNKGVFINIAIGTTGFTAKATTDLSIASATAGVTTNEFTGGGLARAAGALGTYTAETALNGQMTQTITKSFTSTATQTANGIALFDSLTVAGSNMFMEDLFAPAATLANADVMNTTVTASD